MKYKLHNEELERQYPNLLEWAKEMFEEGENWKKEIVANLEPVDDGEGGEGYYIDTAEMGFYYPSKRDMLEDWNLLTDAIEKALPKVKEISVTITRTYWKQKTYKIKTSDLEFAEEQAMGLFNSEVDGISLNLDDDDEIEISYQ